MAIIPLRVLNALESGARGIVAPGVEIGDKPLIKGKGTDTYVCGKCERIIAETASRRDLELFKNGAFKCPECSSVNSL